MDAYAEMAVTYYRQDNEYDRKKALELAHKIVAWCDDDSTHPDNVFHRVKRLMLKGHAGITIDYYERASNRPTSPRRKPGRRPTN